MEGGLRFSCTGCGACCRVEGYVWVERREIRALARFLELEIEEFGARYLRRVGRRVSLVETADHQCVFWRDGCQVYPVRPRQCRTFPFWPRNLVDRESWARTAAECEGIGEGRLYGREEIRRLRAGGGETESGPEPVAGERTGG